MAGPLRVESCGKRALTGVAFHTSSVWVMPYAGQHFMVRLWPAVLILPTPKQICGPYPSSIFHLRHCPSAFEKDGKEA